MSRQQLHGSTTVYINPPQNIKRFSLLSNNGVRIMLNGICVHNSSDNIEHNNCINEPIYATIFANKMNTFEVEWVSNLHTDRIQILDWDTRCVLDEMYMYKAYKSTP